MKTTQISVEFAGGLLANENDVLILIGAVAGECYNSSMADDKCINRALNCIKRGHHSPFEHYNITLKCTVDRGVSHALVRHRHCAFQQASTIYQKFDELTFINNNDVSEDLLKQIEAEYKRLLSEGKHPAEARDILPNMLATYLTITTNVRQWMYMLQRRNGYGDSDNMHKWRDVTHDWFEQHYPIILSTFEDWYRDHPL